MHPRIALSGDADATFVGAPQPAYGRYLPLPTAHLRPYQGGFAALSHFRPQPRNVCGLGTLLRGAQLRKPGSPEARKPGSPEARKPGSPEARKARKPGSPEARKPGSFGQQSDRVKGKNSLQPRVSHERFPDTEEGKKLRNLKQKSTKEHILFGLCLQIVSMAFQLQWRNRYGVKRSSTQCAGTIADNCRDIWL